MKKILILFCCAFLMFTFVGCKNEKKESVSGFVSEISTSFFVAKFDDFFITLSSGLRENPYVKDGKTSYTIDFGLLTFIPIQKAFIFNELPKYSVLLNGKIESQGEFLKNPFNNTFCVDLKRGFKKEDLIEIQIKLDEKSFNKKLVCESEKWKIKYEDIVLELKKIYEKEMKNKLSKKHFDAEIYVQILFDASLSKKDYFWKITVLGKDKTIKNIILDAIDGKVLVDNFKS